MNIYKRSNNTNNVLCNSSVGPYSGGVAINSNNQLHTYGNQDPFKIPVNAQGLSEISEEKPGQVDFKDYEVFAISTQ